MKIQVSCVYCGKHFRETDIDQTKSDLSTEGFIALFKQLGFVVEENGENIDTYCSRTCARGERSLQFA